MQENNKRRNFFSKFGQGAIATAIAAALPTKLLSKATNTETKDDKKITVSIHSSAVKRTN